MTPHGYTPAAVRGLTDTEAAVFCRRLEWSQGEFARRAGVPRPALTHYLRRTRPLCHDRRVRLRRAVEAAGQQVAR